MKKMESSLQSTPPPPVDIDFKIDSFNAQHTLLTSFFFFLSFSFLCSLSEPGLVRNKQKHSIRLYSLVNC